MTGKRILALILDWAASILIVQAIPNGPAYGTQEFSLLTLAIFAVEVALFTWTIGSSFGQRIVGLRVKAEKNDHNPSLIQSLIRTILIVLIIPPLLAGADGRGLHDRITKTKIVKV
jgi:uncharacterized RDD family membrane protein YckC